MQRKQATIIVHRVMGKVGEFTKVVPTLINTDRVVSANDDDSGEFTWIRVVVDDCRDPNKGTYQNWKVKENLHELLLLTNALVPHSMDEVQEGN